MQWMPQMRWFGLDDQLCTVDGKLQCQYLHLDSDTFLKNFAAYNAFLDDNEKPRQTIIRYAVHLKILGNFWFFVMKKAMMMREISNIM